MKETWTRLWAEKPLFCVYTVGVLALIFIAFAAPVIAPGDPYATDMVKALQDPSAKHWLGTDKLGRDVFSRVLYGMQISLFMSLAIVAMIAGVGLIAGSVAGYFGGKVEIVIMRLSDMMLAFPGVVLAIAIAGILGGSILNTILALTAVGWAKYARMVRSLVLKIRNEDYIAAAKTSGAKTVWVLIRHVLPNTLPLVVVTGAMDFGTMMIEVAGLSFLGFGAQPPTPEWGLMLNEGRQYLLQAPWLMYAPGLAILITVSVFNLWSDSLRDVLDPRSTED